MKTVYGNLLVHRKYCHTLPPNARNFVEKALSSLSKEFKWNIVKVTSRSNTVTFSFYPDFDTDPHPSLKQSAKVDLRNGKVSIRTYSSHNPFILHRKETFVESDYPNYELFRGLTKEEEKAGLYDKRHLNRIGRRDFWNRLLRKKGLKTLGHRLIECTDSDVKLRKDVRPGSGRQLQLFHSITPKGGELKKSALTAISRAYPSLPARLAVEKGLIHGPIFDWGCGRSRDTEFFREKGYEAEGWDPYYKKDRPPESFPKGYFHWVQCLYVLNTIVESEIREKVLHDIFYFLPSGGHLFIAVRSFSEVDRLAQVKQWRKYNDGWLTSRGTFQKGFTSTELFSLLKQSGFVRLKIIKSKPLIVMGTKP